jgi:hypothetical protein
MTALSIPGVGTRSLPATGGGVDRAIRMSTAAVVLAVAGIAAYISYWHAYAVVREYGESGVTAALEPATIDGLVYASSMVILHAARYRLPVPRLARWMLALGIAASLAVNVAQGWSHGLVGAVVAAWPAVSLVGSYELLAWIIRTAAPAGPDRVPAANNPGPQADQPATSLPAETGQKQAPGPEDGPRHHTSPVPTAVGSPHPMVRTLVGQASEPVQTGSDRASRADQADGPGRAADHADQDRAMPVAGSTTNPVGDINAAAVTAYRDSLRIGAPLSERKLAEMFGLSSRRWARNRMAEARQTQAAA